MSVKIQAMDSPVPQPALIKTVDIEDPKKQREIAQNISPNQEILSSESSPKESTTATANSIKSPAVKVEVVSDNEVIDGQQCSNCATTKTPLWRRAPNGTLICNACGLYLRSNGSHRPINLKKRPNLITVKKAEGSCSGNGKCNGTGGSAACKGCPAYNNRVILLKKHEDKSTTKACTASTTASATGGTVEDANKDDLAIACYNCSTTVTPLWRRDDNGNTICNACGLYYKLHGSHRPVKMKKPTIKRRKRNNDKKATNETNFKVEDVEILNNSNSNRNSATISPIPQISQNPSISSPIYPQVSSPRPFVTAGTTANLLPQASSSIPQPAQLPIPHFQYPYGLAQHHFPPYQGGRIPNGPGPVPGPPPPSLYNPLIRPNMQFSSMLPYQPINIPPIQLSQPQVQPVPIQQPQQQAQLPQQAQQPQPLPQPSQTLQPQPLPQPSQTLHPQPLPLQSSSPIPTQQSTPPREPVKPPIAVDFTNSFKTDSKITIGGLLNE